jgi:hypothetical protein
MSWKPDAFMNGRRNLQEKKLKAASKLIEGGPFNLRARIKNVSDLKSALAFENFTSST